MTCRDCIHHGVCENYFYFDDVEDTCENFKDKSKFIELPCKVGDTVYYIAGKKVYKSKCHAITQHKNGLQIHLYDYDGDNARYSTKDVFLTEEEAEKALKEQIQK